MYSGALFSITRPSSLGSSRASCAFSRTIEAVSNVSQCLPECGHGDDGIPESLWNAGELCTRNVLLGVVHDRREDDDCHAESEEQEAEFGGTAAQRVSKDTQSGGVARKLKDTENAEHSQSNERAAYFVVFWNAQSDVIWQDGDYIDDAHYGTRVSENNTNLKSKISAVEFLQHVGMTKKE